MSSEQTVPMYVHFRAGTDPLMTAWDFCILYGKPELTHGNCVEDTMVSHCHQCSMHAPHQKLIYFLQLYSIRYHSVHTVQVWHVKQNAGCGNVVLLVQQLVSSVHHLKRILS